MSARFETQPARFDARLDAWFDELVRRIDALRRGTIVFGSGILLLVLATLVSVIATRA